MNNHKWNKCVCENKVFLCKAPGSCMCHHATVRGILKRCGHVRSRLDGFVCGNPIAQKEALCFLIDKCERDSKWAGFKLSELE